MYSNQCPTKGWMDTKFHSRLMPDYSLALCQVSMTVVVKDRRVGAWEKSGRRRGRKGKKWEYQGGGTARNCEYLTTFPYIPQ